MVFSKNRLIDITKYQSVGKASIALPTFYLCAAPFSASLSFAPYHTLLRLPSHLFPVSSLLLSAVLFFCRSKPCNTSARWRDLFMAIMRSKTYKPLLHLRLKRRWWFFLFLILCLPNICFQSHSLLPFLHLFLFDFSIFLPISPALLSLGIFHSIIPAPSSDCNLCVRILSSMADANSKAKSITKRAENAAQKREK